jgi:hypothetical protein
MKRISLFALLFSLLSIPALAANNTQTVTFTDTVTIGSAKLPAGDYKITWTGAAPNVQVTLVQKDARHPATATTAARLVDEKHDRVQLMTRNDAGVNALEQIQLKSVSLVFSASPASGQ